MSSGRRASLVLGALLGVAIGLGLYTFVYARGYSYLTNDASACVNCHVMQDQYAGWLKSSHRSVAVCNDCHTPHDLAGKYAVKALNGFSHSLAFTTGRFPDVIRIKERSRQVTEGACLTCHGDMVAAITANHSPQDTDCLRCHSNVGHSAAAFEPSTLPLRAANREDPLHATTP